MMRLHRRSNEDRGAAAVEFALVLPLLIAILLGVIEFGFAFNTQISLTQAAREGVRLEALDTGNAEQATRDAYLGAMGTGADLAVSVTECPNSNEKAQVSATYNYTPIFLPMLSGALTGEAVMRCGG